MFFFFFSSVHQTGEEVGKVKDKRTSQKIYKKKMLETYNTHLNDMRNESWIVNYFPYLYTHFTFPYNSTLLSFLDKMYAFQYILLYTKWNVRFVFLHPVCPPVVISLLLGPNIKLQHRIFLPSYHFIHTRNSTHVLTPHNRSQKMDILSKWFGTNDTYVYINHVYVLNIRTCSFRRGDLCAR